MKRLLIATLVLVSTNVLADDGQIATLVSFESAVARPIKTQSNESNITSIVNASMEFTSPQNLSLYGGASFILGETFESAFNIGARYYSSAPAFQIIPSAPMWSFVGGGMSFYDKTVYYPEAGFRIGISNTARLDIFIKLLNSQGNTYDKHVMAGIGLTF